jgi:BASS family bile acid:Na+ symporter
MLIVGLVIGHVLRLKKSQITLLSIEAGFQNGTVGIVVGSLISEELIQVGLSRFRLPSAVYNILMLVTIIPFILWRISLLYETLVCVFPWRNSFLL